ncbi:MAG: GntR family transcriptional regulator [Ferruginibacter sp.]
MQKLFNIDIDRKIPKYLQIVNTVTNAIRLGKLKKGDHIFSINELSDEFLLSRDTVQKAYSLLRKKGVITAVKGKGFYVNRTDITTPFRILLLFNKISNYKKQIYNAFVETMGNKAIVDLKIHHFSTELFESLIMEYIDEYDYCVIMPHFYDDADEIYRIIKKIPSEKLILLDKDLPHTCSNYAGVYQDFKNDIYNALESGLHLISKYDKMILVYPKIIPYPKEIIVGFRSFCTSYNIPYQVINELDPKTVIHKKEVYIVIEETDLVTLIKSCQHRGLEIGKDIGIISYNETPLKEILLDGITVISTDHYKMGETAATLILENRKEKIKNPFVLIQRKSL